MRNTTLPAVAVGALAICLSSAPSHADIRRMVLVDHARLGACVYSVLDRIYPGQVRITDPEGVGTIRITLEEAFVGRFGSPSQRPADLELRRNGRRTEVAITANPTMWGSDSDAERTWRQIQGCLPPGP